MILYRAVAQSVRFAERQVDIVAVPFGQIIEAEDRPGHLYKEAFDPHLQLELLRDPVPALLHHDPTQPFGHVRLHKTRTTGITGTMVAAQTASGDEALELADAGVLHPSIGFSSIAHETRDRVRWRTAIVLHEVSLVTFPGYPGATVTAVRAAKQNIPPNLLQAMGLRNRLRGTGTWPHTTG